MINITNFIALFVILLSFNIAQSCKSLWDNSCTSNRQCCSGFCDNKNGQWAFGVCKSGSGNNNSNNGNNGGNNNNESDDDNSNGNGNSNGNSNSNSQCKQLWDNSCASNGECCSHHCDNNNGQWAFGVCKP